MTSVHLPSCLKRAQSNMSTSKMGEYVQVRDDSAVWEEHAFDQGGDQGGYPEVEPNVNLASHLSLNCLKTAHERLHPTLCRSSFLSL